jgi:hypothetical protein
MSRKSFRIASALSAIAVFGAAQAPNDQPAGATLVVGPAAVADDNSASVVDGPLGSCGLMSADLWYYYVPTATGIATVTTCSGSASGLGNIAGIGDSVIAAWNDAGGFPGGQIVCIDDSCTTTGLATTITFPIISGVGVYVSVGGFNGNIGTYTVEFAEGVPLPGDDCSAAYTIAGPGVIAFSSSSALSGSSASCAGGPDMNDQWIAYTATLSGIAYASTCTSSVNAPGGSNAGLSTYLAVYTSCPAVNFGDTACDDGTAAPCGFLNGAEVAFPITAGVTYYIQCGDWSNFGSVGGVVVSIAEAVLPPSAFTDDCSTAGVVVEGVYGYSTIGFGVAGPAATCSASGSDPLDGWLLYTPTNNGIATFSNCAASTAAPGGGVLVGTDTYIAIWDASSCPPTVQLACADSSPNCGGPSEASIGVCAGSVYYVQVGNWGAPAAISGSIAIALVPSGGGGGSGPGDDPSVAVVHPLNVAVPYASAGFSSAGPASNCSGIGGTDTFDFWFTFVAPATGIAVASNCGASAIAPGGSASPTDTYIGAFGGSSCGLPTGEIACADGSPNCGGESEVQFSVTAGQTYFVSVGTWGSPSANTGALNIAIILPPANDDCANAIPISTGLTTGTNIGASTASPSGSCGMTGEVWYSLVVPCTGGKLILDTCGSSFDTTLSVWDNCGGVELGCNDQAGSIGNCQFTSQSYLEVTGLSAGQTVYIAVGGWNGNTGSFNLNVVCEYVHLWTVPAGPGSVQLENVDGPANSLAFSAVTLDLLHPGLPANQTFPNGWFFGVPMGFPELFQQITWPGGLPFTGILGPNGYLFNFALPTGTTSGLAGIATVWSVGVAFDPLTGFATVGDTTDPTAFPL